MNNLLKSTYSNPKIYEMSNFLVGYWEQDSWCLKDDIFAEYRKTSSRADISYKKINFDCFKPNLKMECKYFLKYRLENRIVTLDTILKYGQTFKRLIAFLSEYYPDINSFAEIELDKAIIRLRTHFAFYFKKNWVY